MNSMDEPIDTVHTERSGISRRDMIKASVVAGGLVWSAPILLSGTAAAAPHPCCPTGFESAIAFKVTGTTAVNCGSSCLDARAGTNLPCDSGLADCLLDEDFVIVDEFDGNDGTATIRITQNARLIAAAANTPRFCFFTDCPTFATGPGSGTPNTCTSNQTCPTVPPNRIWVTTLPDNDPNTVDFTTVVVQLQPSDGNLNHVELYLCVNSVITGICP
jgi:hypothetical protein